MTASGEIDISGVGYSPEGGVTESGKPLMDGTKVLAEAQVRCAAGDRERRQPRPGRRAAGRSGRSTEAAFWSPRTRSRASSTTPAPTNGLEVPFTSARKMMSVVGELRTPAQSYTKGTDVCCRTRHRAGGNEQCRGRRAAPDPGQDRTVGGQAYRTLAVAFRDWPAWPNSVRSSTRRTNRPLLVAIAAMIDPPRRGRGVRRRGAPGGNPGADDHRRPPGHRGPHRLRPGHRRARRGSDHQHPDRPDGRRRCAGGRDHRFAQ